MSILSLKEAALAAYKEVQEVEQERLAERRASIERLARQAFAKIFGIEPDSMETIGKSTLVSAGGITVRYDGEGSFYMWGTCPRCLQLDTGQYVDSLELLGKALAEGFTPSYMHHCRADYEPPEPEPAPDPMVTALQAIAAELKRHNDYNGEPVVVRFRPMDEGVIPEPAEGDPFMPPDEVWRWLPNAKCVATDENGKCFWYDGEVTPSKDEWFAPGMGPHAEIGFFGVRDLGGADWRTTKRTRPAHL